MELVSTVQVGDRWVTQCAWAPWETLDAQTGRWEFRYVNVPSHPISSRIDTCVWDKQRRHHSHRCFPEVPLGSSRIALQLRSYDCDTE